MAIEFRSWTAGDESKILDLFALTFGRPMSLEFWRWRFLDHPSGGPLIVLAWDGDKIAAHYAACHAPLFVDGSRVDAALSMTTMTHPDYRGQRLFDRSASALYAMMEGAGIEAVVGFPNRNSNVPFQSKLDWRMQADVCMLTADVANVRSTVGPHGGEVVEVSAIDDRFDRFAARTSATNGIVSARDKGVFAWRVDANPVAQYIRLVLPSGEADLAGYAILKRYTESEYDMVELRAQDIDSARTIIACAVEKVRSYDAKKLNTWCLFRDPLRVALERTGFGADAPVTYFGGRAFASWTQAGRGELDDPRRWQVSMLDSDLY